MKNLNVLLVDDHPLLLEGLRLLINAQPDMKVVGEADCGPVAIEVAEQVKPDVVVMDVSMPKGGGVRAVQKFRETYPSMRVLILTRHDEAVYLQQLLQAGISGYVVKRAASKDLVTAIRTVADGGVYVDPSIAHRVVAGFIGRSASQRLTQNVRLSERETEVLRQTAWGYSNKEIAHSLHLSVKTVETYKARVMTKLNLNSRTDIVRFAVNQGWMDDN
jgi:DNA-binding NarL/FixJ family response regulator